MFAKMAAERKAVDFRHINIKDHTVKGCILKKFPGFLRRTALIDFISLSGEINPIALQKIQIIINKQKFLHINILLAYHVKRFLRFRRNYLMHRYNLLYHALRKRRKEKNRKKSKNSQIELEMPISVS